MPVFPALGRWQQEEQESKVILDYMVSRRSDWAIGYSVSKKKKNPVRKAWGTWPKNGWRDCRLQRTGEFAMRLCFPVTSEATPKTIQMS